MSSATPEPRSDRPAPVSADAFRAALAAFPSGVTIITSADAKGAPNGVTISAFASLSLDPPLVLASLSSPSRTLAAITECNAFVAHILSQQNAGLAARFASGSDDKFQGVEYTTNTYGAPLIKECPIRLECLLESEHAAGDHVVLVGLVVEAAASAEAGPLVYYQREFRGLGGPLSPG